MRIIFAIVGVLSVCFYVASLGLSFTTEEKRKQRARIIWAIGAFFNVIAAMIAFYPHLLSSIS